MRHFIRWISLLTVGLLLIFGSTVAAQEPIVRVLLFHSPTCPHCRVVIEEVLPPLQAQHGGQLEIALVDTSQPDGNELFQRALRYWNAAPDQQGVPFMVVDDVIMVGSTEIPEQLPDLITSRLDTGGTVWPELAGFDSYLERHGLSGAEAGKPSGIGLAAMVLILLITAFITAAGRILVVKPRLAQLKRLQSTNVPALATLGLLVATYLSWVEMTTNEAICGPIGACNVVQSSPYASLLGVPIAIWGLLTYTLIMLLWFMQLENTPWVATALISLGFVSVLFSTYLTIVEIYVIEAVCLWCLASAVISAVLLLLMVFEAVQRASQPKSRYRKHKARRTA